MGGVLTQIADRLGFYLAAVNINAGGPLELVSDHLRRDGAVQLAGVASPHGEGQDGAVDPFGHSAHFLVQQGALGSSLLADLVSLLDRTGGGQHGQALGDQVIAAVAVRDTLDVARAAQFVNVFYQEYFHRNQALSIDWIGEGYNASNGRILPEVRNSVNER